MIAWTRAAKCLACLLCAGACNQIFGVEDSRLVSDAAGGEGGQGEGDGGSPNPSGGASGEGARGQGGDAQATGGEGGVGPTEPGETAGAGAGGAAGIPSTTPSPGGSPSTPPNTGGEAGARGGSGGAGGAPDAPEAGTAGAPSCTDEVSCKNETTELRCVGGALQESPCTFGCLGGSCAECEPDETQCHGDQSRVRTCDDDGRWGNYVLCDEATCFDGACRGSCLVGTPLCDDDGDARFCNEAGNWELEKTCTSQSEICVIQGSESRCIQNTPWAFPPSSAYPDLTPAGADYLNVFPIGEPQFTAYVVSLELFGSAASQGVARLVLYKDDGGRPGDLVTSTASVIVTADGPNGGVPLDLGAQVEAGTAYWIGVVFQDGGSPQIRSLADMDAPAGYQIQHPFTSAFPDPFPAIAIAIHNTEWNLFLMVQTRTP